jgi:hypothetical protein
MRASDLLSPGVLSNGQTLRHETAHAISRGEINIGRNNADTLTALATYFADAAAKCTATISAATPDETESSAAALPTTIDDDGVDESVVTFTILNEDQDPVSRVPVTVVVTGTAVDPVVSALAGYTNGDGEFVVTVSGVGTGTVILTATIEWLGADFTEAATVTIATP